MKIDYTKLVIVFLNVLVVALLTAIYLKPAPSSTKYQMVKSDGTAMVVLNVQSGEMYYNDGDGYYTEEDGKEVRINKLP